MDGGKTEALELWGSWRLFTRREFEHVHGDRRPELAALKHHVHALSFEHGSEGKTPRANTFRPYRLSLNGTLIAAIALRASEAFNLCEVDAFVTADLPGPEPLEATRAALLFVFCDAAKNAGSMAVQFTPACAPAGVPQSVRELAARSGVALAHVERGTLSPDESRELFLRLCGLPKAACDRVRALSAQGLISVERACCLVTLGVWPAQELAQLLESFRHADLLLATGIEAGSRHLSAYALACARTVILGGVFARALRYIEPGAAGASSVLERRRFASFPHTCDPDRLSIRFGPLPTQTTLRGWNAVGDAPVIFSPGSLVEVLARGRFAEEIRAFLRQDLDEAEAAAGSSSCTVVLAYPADYLELSHDEQVEAAAASSRRRVTIVSCPESAASLESEAFRRVRVGKTVRR